MAFVCCILESAMWPTDEVVLPLWADPHSLAWIFCSSSSENGVLQYIHQQSLSWNISQCCMNGWSYCHHNTIFQYFYEIMKTHYIQELIVILKLACVIYWNPSNQVGDIVPLYYKIIWYNIAVLTSVVLQEGSLNKDQYQDGCGVSNQLAHDYMYWSSRCAQSSCKFE